MKDKDLGIFSFMGLVFSFPFIIMMILSNFTGYEENKTWSLIILGMAIAGFPVAVFGVFKIFFLLTNEQQNKPEVNHE